MTDLIPAPTPGLMGWAGPSAESAARDRTITRETKRQELDPTYRPQYVPIADLRARPIPSPILGSSEAPDGGTVNETRFVFWDILDRLGVSSSVQAGPQALGDCVGYSAALAIADLAAREILVTGDLETFRVPFVPWLYGIGRVYVGNGRIRGDGSLGDWQIAAARQYGVLAAETSGLPGYSASIGRAWGSRRDVLDTWKDKAQPFRIGSAARVTSWEQLTDVVLRKKLPATIASMQGFERMEKDSDTKKTYGRAAGRWAHQMHIRGIDLDPRRPCAFVGNQWGLIYDQIDGPRSGFWVDADFMDNWLRNPATYCTTYEEFSGYPQPTPTWEMF